MQIFSRGHYNTSTSAKFEAFTPYYYSTYEAEGEGRCNL